MEFVWDDFKAEANLDKHGVSFHEAASLFADPLTITFHDPDHSAEEDRFITIGYSSGSRLLIVAHTDHDGRIRIISARETTRRERRLYEDNDQ